MGAIFSEISGTKVTIVSGGVSLVITGSNLSFPGATVGGSTALVDGDAVSGAISSLLFYSGGTEIAGVVVSSTSLTVSAGSVLFEIDGSGLPTSFLSIASILTGSFFGTSSVSDIKFSTGGATDTLSLSSAGITITAGDYQMLIAGSFVSSLSLSSIENLLSEGNLDALVSPLSLNNLVTGVTVKQISTGQTVLTASDFGAGATIASVLGSNNLISNLLSGGRNIGIDAPSSTIDATFGVPTQGLATSTVTVNGVSQTSSSTTTTTSTNISVDGSTLIDGSESTPINIVGKTVDASFSAQATYQAPIISYNTAELLGAAGSPEYIVRRDSADLVEIDVSFPGSDTDGPTVYIQNASEIQIGNQVVSLASLANPIPNGLQTATALRPALFAGALPITTGFPGATSLGGADPETFPEPSRTLSRLASLDGATNITYALSNGNAVDTATNAAGQVVNVVTFYPGSTVNGAAIPGQTTDVYTDPTTGDVVTTTTTFKGRALVNTMTQVATTAAGEMIASYALKADGTAVELDYSGGVLAGEADYASTGTLSRYKAVNADGSYSTSNDILGSFRGDTQGNADGSSRTEQIDNGKIETYTTVSAAGALVSTGFDAGGQVDRYEVGNQDLDLVNGQMVYYQRESRTGSNVQGESIQVNAAGDILEYSDLVYGSNVDGVGVTTSGTVTLYYNEAIGTGEGVEGQWSPTGGSLLEYSDLNSAGTGYAYSAIYGTGGAAAASAYETAAGVSVTLLGTNYAGYWQVNATAIEVANLAAALTQDLALNSADADAAMVAAPSGTGFQDLYQQVALGLPALVAATDQGLASSTQQALAQILSSADTKGALLTAYPDGSIAAHLSDLSDTLILPASSGDPKARLFTDATAYVSDLLSADVEAAIVAPAMLAGLEAGSVTLAQLAQAMASFGAAGGAASLTAAETAFTSADLQYIASNPTGANQIIQSAAQSVFTHLYAKAHSI